MNFGEAPVALGYSQAELSVGINQNGITRWLTVGPLRDESLFTSNSRCRWPDPNCDGKALER